MRRKERAVTDAAQIAEILSRCETLSVAFGGGAPYVVPMHFGFREEGGRFCLYLHCAGEGEKLRRMRDDPRAAFAAVARQDVRPAPVACRYTTAYESVCGEGVLSFAEGEEKREGLTRLMAQLAPGRAFEWNEEALTAVTVLRLDVREINGKRSA